MKTKHTPKPMRVVEHNTAYTVHQKGMLSVATFEHECGDQKINKANAHLFASAPHMLETLYAIRESIEGSRYKDKLCPELAKIDFAIAQAEGRDK